MGINSSFQKKLLHTIVREATIYPGKRASGGRGSFRMSALSNERCATYADVMISFMFCSFQVCTEAGNRTVKAQEKPCMDKLHACSFTHNVIVRESIKLHLHIYFLKYGTDLMQHCTHAVVIVYV